MSDVKNGDVEFGKEESGKNNKKMIAIIAGSIVAVILAILIIVGIAGGNEKTPIKNFYKGLEKGSSKTLIKALPKFMQEDAEDNITDEMVEDLRETMEKECGDKLKISFKVVGKIKLDEDDLEDTKDSLEKKYEDEKIKVTKGYEVCVKQTVKGSDETVETFEEFKVYKVNGKWCILSVL